MKKEMEELIKLIYAHSKFWGFGTHKVIGDVKYYIDIDCATSHVKDSYFTIELDFVEITHNHYREIEVTLGTDYFEKTDILAYINFRKNKTLIEFDFWEWSRKVRKELTTNEQKIDKQVYKRRVTF